MGKNLDNVNKYIKQNSCFAKCNECGHKFKTLKAAEKAALGDRGCPGCGGSDIEV